MAAIGALLAVVTPGGEAAHQDAVSEHERVKAEERARDRSGGSAGG